MNKIFFLILAFTVTAFASKAERNSLMGLNLSSKRYGDALVYTVASASSQAKLTLYEQDNIGWHGVIKDRAVQYPPMHVITREQARAWVALCECYFSPEGSTVFSILSHSDRKKGTTDRRQQVGRLYGLEQTSEDGLAVSAECLGLKFFFTRGRDKPALRISHYGVSWTFDGETSYFLIFNSRYETCQHDPIELNSSSGRMRELIRDVCETMCTPQSKINSSD